MYNKPPVHVVPYFDVNKEGSTLGCMNTYFIRKDENFSNHCFGAYVSPHKEFLRMQTRLSPNSKMPRRGVI